MKKNILLFSVLCMIGLISCKKEKPSDLVNETTVADASTTDGSVNTTNINATNKPEGTENQANPDIDPATAPEITFEKLAHDFGTIPYGEKVKYDFTFTNSGKTPLVVESVKPSCGCTVPAKPEAPIAPGESGTITVEFNPKNYNGKQGSSVTVKTNTVKGSEVLRISANVENAPGKPKTDGSKNNPTVSSNAPVKANS